MHTSKLIVNGELRLDGPVGFKDPDGEGFTAGEVAEAVDTLQKSQPLASELVVRINSPGGDVFTGVNIFNTLKSRKGQVRIKAVIDGMALSAGSLIAMAADTIVMAEGSIMMIHGASGVTFGDVAEHESTIARLKIINEQAARTYAKRSGQPVAEVQQLMADETWFSADEAVALGFADESEAPTEGDDTMGTGSRDLMVFDYTRYKNAPDHLLAWVSEWEHRGLIRPHGRPDMAAQSVDSPTQTETEIDMADKTKGDAGTAAPRETDYGSLSADTLVEQRPDLVEALTQSAALDAILAERKRIADIDEIALAGHEALIAECKENGMSAAEAATAVMKAEKALRSNKLAEMRADESDDLPGSQSVSGQEMVEDDADETVNVVTDDSLKAKFEKSAALQSEFGTFDLYRAYALAQASGRVRTLRDKS